MFVVCFLCCFFLCVSVVKLFAFVKLFLPIKDYYYTPELNKPAVLQEFLTSDPLNPIDILSLAETWLPCDPLPAVLNSLTPPGYSFINSPRLHGKGGGLALIFKSCLKIKTVSIPLFSSFESLCVRLTIETTCPKHRYYS